MIKNFLKSIATAICIGIILYAGQALAAGLQGGGVASDVIGGTGADSLRTLSDVTITSGTAGDVLVFDGTEWVNTASGSVSPAGSDTQIQLNSGGSFGADSNFTFNSTSAVLTVTGTGSFGTAIIEALAITPDAHFEIANSGSTIPSFPSHVHISSTTDIVMNSTPTITDGKDGAILILHNTGSTTIDIQDEADLPNSNVRIDGASRTIKPEGHMMLMFSEATTTWSILSNPNRSGSGATAETLNVRNQSGIPIGQGRAVYVSGFNNGQNRITIDVTDADDLTKMPAIGITLGTIANGTNGDIAILGEANQVIDTSSASVGDGVWIEAVTGHNVGGALVFTRPSADAVQRIGTVTRSNANGNILVQGAGRINDSPNNITASGVIVTDDIEFNSTPILNDSSCNDVRTVTVDVNSVGSGALLGIAPDGNWETANAHTGSTVQRSYGLALQDGTGSKKICLSGLVHNASFSFTVTGATVYTASGSGIFTEDTSTLSTTGDAIQAVGIIWSVDNKIVNFKPSFSKNEFTE